MNASHRRYAVNLSILFPEVPLLQRPAVAREAGFTEVEFWWPFPQAVPADREVDAFVRAVQDAGVALVGLNFFAGDMPGGDAGWCRGRLAPRSSATTSTSLSAWLGCRAFNALYGNRVEESTPEAQDALAIENLALAGRAVARVGGTALVEPLSGAPHYPLRTAADVVGVIDRVAEESGVTNLGFLCDLYHLAVNVEDLDAVFATYADRVAHVQVADAPGRHEPGTGELDLDGYLCKLEAAGYDGWVALEYKPRNHTADALRWLPRAQRSAAPLRMLASHTTMRPEGLP